MRIISFNANGIRSAASKGFFDWLAGQDADVVCLQETKSQEHQLADACFRPDGHHCFYRDATSKKGYSGVAIYARREPDEVRTVLGRPDFDEEGRYIEARLGNLSVVSFYIPSGSSRSETTSQEHQLAAACFRPDGHHCFYRDATSKKGYSGVAIYARREPDEVRTVLGRPDFDEEGRYIEARFGNLSVVSFYIPSGSSGELRQGYKFQIMEWLKPVLDEWLASGREYVLCGDWNIVRCRKDIRNWTSNQKNSGCLPPERAWLNGMIGQ